MTISLQSVVKKFPIKQSNKYLQVLDNISLDVSDGAIVSLFGPNGCGKTTILNIVAGIESADSGIVLASMTDNDRPAVGYAFQNFRDVLLPWETAFDNVTFGLRAMGIPYAEAAQRTEAFLDRFGLVFPRDNYPYQLSVGQQQTVALARTLIQKPANVLLDEPFVALDHEARFWMQDVVLSVLTEMPTAILLISHDVDEALYMSDELLLLSKRPAKVLERFPIPFERPRKHDLLTSTAFSTLRREVVAAFLKEMKT